MSNSHFARERKGLLKIVLRLAGKADDDVRRDADVRPGAAQFFDEAEEAFARVAAVHQFQNAVAAALDGQVRALDQLGQPRVSLNQIVAVAFRMWRREPDAFQPLDFVDGVEQLDEGGCSRVVRESRVSSAEFSGRPSPSALAYYSRLP